MLYSVTIYRTEAIWVCDDHVHLGESVPFTREASEVLTELQLRQGIPGDTLFLTFSDSPFSNYQLALRWIRSDKEGVWNTYESNAVNMKLTISSRLKQYFHHPPNEVFLTIDVCDER